MNLDLGANQWEDKTVGHFSLSHQQRELIFKYWIKSESCAWLDLLSSRGLVID